MPGACTRRRGLTAVAATYGIEILGRPSIRA